MGCLLVEFDMIYILCFKIECSSNLWHNFTGSSYFLDFFHVNCYLKNHLSKEFLNSMKLSLAVVLVIFFNEVKKWRWRIVFQFLINITLSCLFY